MKKRINSIEIFRYVCAVTVVIIHAHPLEDTDAFLSMLASSVFSRFAVPFFFAAAGYFYIQKLEAGQKPFRKYITRLITAYALWSCVYFLLRFIRVGHSDLRGFVITSVYGFFIAGSEYHFWFFPALIYSVCLVTALWRLGAGKAVIPLGILLFLPGCLAFSYTGLAVRLPGIGRIFADDKYEAFFRIFSFGFPFFTCGYAVKRLSEKGIGRRKIHAGLALSIILWLMEIYLLEKFALARSFRLTLMLYPLSLFILLALIAHPMPEAAEFAGKCRAMANFTYYSHPLFLSLFTGLFSRVTGTDGGALPVFLLSVLTASLAGLAVYKADNRFLNRLII